MSSSYGTTSRDTNTVISSPSFPTLVKDVINNIYQTLPLNAGEKDPKTINVSLKKGRSFQTVRSATVLRKAELYQDTEFSLSFLPGSVPQGSFVTKSLARQHFLFLFMLEFSKNN